MNVIKKNKFWLFGSGVCVVLLGLNNFLVPIIMNNLSGELSPFRVTDFRSVKIKDGFVTRTCQEFKVQGHSYPFTQGHCIGLIAQDKLLISDRPVRSDTGQEVKLSDQQPEPGSASILYELNGKAGVIPIIILSYDQKKGIGLYQNLDDSPVQSGISGGPVIQGSFKGYQFKGSVVIGIANAAITKTDMPQKNSKKGYFTGNKVE